MYKILVIWKLLYIGKGDLMAYIIYRKGGFNDICGITLKLYC